MQNLADVLVAGFVFLLFVSIYRKKSTASVRFWLAGWFFVLLHFAALALHPQAPAAQVAQSLVALGTLVLCGTSFVLSYPESHTSTAMQFWVAGLLGTPWLLATIFASMPHPWFAGMAVCAYLGSASMLWVSFRLFGQKKRRFSLLALLVAGCTAWLTLALPSHAPEMVVSVVLTQCFGLDAVVLSMRRSRVSAATATISVGAIGWAAVWVASALTRHFAPEITIGAELWNLPKYFVAAGMVLSLLEEEIRSAKLTTDEYRLLFAGNPHPMWIYDTESLRFLDVNEAAVAHYGYTRDEFQSLTVPEVVHVTHDPDALAELRSAEPQQLSGPWLHQRRDGSEFQVEIASQPVIRDGRSATFTLIHDVTEPQRLHAQLIRQAHHDVLTDLPNRALFERRMEDTLKQAARTRRKAAVFCIDLDRFKQINDSYGHGAGDRCLREVAQRINARIAACLNGAGTLARTGGDEFMLIFGDLHEAHEAEAFATDLLAELRHSVHLDRGEVELGASIGIAVFPDDGHESAQLWRDADAAMYRAKRAGGSEWVRVSREISSSASEANDIEISLRRALKAGEFEVYYQPQMTIDGRLHCLEALVRSSDPLLRQTAPDRFISIAEESGLIVPLGDWVLEEVCRQSRAWIDEGIAPVQIAVNVSPLQLTRFDFTRKVASALERHELSPHMLEFEVTESTVMPDRGDAPHQIAMLARMGIRFSVDDFGTGYSSLGRLHQLPVDSLKIDCSFTRHIADRKGTYPTVQAIIALAHTLGMKVVAEGVEDEHQLRLLRSLECDRVQGFLFCRPLPGEQVKLFLQNCAGLLDEEGVA